MGKLRGWLLGLVVGGFFLYLALRQIDVPQVGRILLNADPALIVVGFLLTAANYVARGYRWRYLLRPVADLGTGRGTLFVMFGTGVNYVLPGRMGEFARAYTFGQAYGVSKTLSFGTLVLERAFDTAVLLLFFVAGLLLSRHGGGKSTRMLLVGGLVVVLAVGIGVVTRYSAQLVRVVDRLLGPRWPALSQRIGALLESLLAGLSCANTPSRLGGMAFISVASWLITVASTYTVYLALRAPSLPVVSTMVLMGATAASMLIPNAPGNVGTNQFVAIWVLSSMFGISTDLAVGISVVLQGMDMVLTLASIPFVLRGPRLALKDLAPTTLEPAAPAP